jgi:hypothetical protein
VAQLGRNAHGEVLEPGRVPDCYLGLRLDPPAAEAREVLVVAPAALLHPVVPQPDGRVLYELVTGHPDRTPHELVFVADLTVELRAWPAGTWAKVEVDPQAAPGAVVAGWQRGDLLGLRLGGLTAEEALALERPAVTYVRAQLGDRLQGGGGPAAASGTHGSAVQVTLGRLRWSPGPGRRSRRRSAVRTRGHRTRPAGHRGPGIADARDRGRGMRTLRQRPVGQPAAKPSTAACMSGRQRDRKVRHRPTPPWPDRQIVAWCSVSIWSAPDGSGLLILGASSVASGPDGSRRIVWRINRMIKRGRQLDSLTAADLDSAVDPHPPTW